MQREMVERLEALAELLLKVAELLKRPGDAKLTPQQLSIARLATVPEMNAVMEEIRFRILSGVTIEEPVERLLDLERELRALGS